VSEQVVWSCEIELDYPYYQVGEPDAEAIGGLRTAPIAGGESGVFVATDARSAQARLEVVIADAPPHPAEGWAGGLRVAADDLVSITTWDNETTRPDSYDLIGAGLWRVWVHRQVVNDPDAGQVEDHRLYLFPEDDRSRRWAAGAAHELAARRQAALEEAATRQLDYFVFVKKAGIYFVVWDTVSFTKAIGEVDLKVALSDDTVLLELPGGAAFRKRPRTELWAIAEPGGFTNVHNEPRLTRFLEAHDEARLLDGSFQPVRNVPDPAAKTPCVVRIGRDVADYAAWYREHNQPVPPEVEEGPGGSHDWSVQFADEDVEKRANGPG
jgi:hypothetical protein